MGSEKKPEPVREPFTVIPVAQFVGRPSRYLPLAVLVVSALWVWLHFTGWLEALIILYYPWITDGAFHATQPWALGVLAGGALLCLVLLSRNLFIRIVEFAYCYTLDAPDRTTWLTRSLSSVLRQPIPYVEAYALQRLWQAAHRLMTAEQPATAAVEEGISRRHGVGMCWVPAGVAVSLAFWAYSMPAAPPWPRMLLGPLVVLSGMLVGLFGPNRIAALVAMAPVASVPWWLPTYLSIEERGAFSLLLIVVEALGLACLDWIGHRRPEQTPLKDYDAHWRFQVESIWLEASMLDSAARRIVRHVRRLCRGVNLADYERVLNGVFESLESDPAAVELLALLRLGETDGALRSALESGKRRVVRRALERTLHRRARVSLARLHTARVLAIWKAVSEHAEDRGDPQTRRRVRASLAGQLRHLERHLPAELDEIRTLLRRVHDVRESAEKFERAFAGAGGRGSSTRNGAWTSFRHELDQALCDPQAQRPGIAESSCTALGSSLILIDQALAALVHIQHWEQIQTMLIQVDDHGPWAFLDGRRLEGALLCWLALAPWEGSDLRPVALEDLVPFAERWKEWGVELLEGRFGRGGDPTGLTRAHIEQAFARVFSIRPAARSRALAALPEQIVQAHPQLRNLRSWNSNHGN
jgi:hypothetical protein